MLEGEVGFKFKAGLFHTVRTSLKTKPTKQQTSNIKKIDIAFQLYLKNNFFQGNESCQGHR